MRGCLTNLCTAAVLFLYKSLQSSKLLPTFAMCKKSGTLFLLVYFLRIIENFRAFRLSRVTKTNINVVV